MRIIRRIVMKRFLALVISVVCLALAFTFTACSNGEVGENGSVSVKYYQSGGDMLPLLYEFYKRVLCDT